MEMMQAQIKDIQANIQSTQGEQENNPNMFEKVGEIVEEGVVQTEEDTTLEECGELEIVKEIETPQKKNSLKNGQILKRL